MKNFTLGCVSKAGLKHRKSRQQARAADWKGGKIIPSACFACARALKSCVGSCLQLCRRDQGLPHLFGRRGVSLALWGSSFPLHPSSAPSLCSPPFPCSSSLAFYSWGRKDHFCLHFKRVLNWLCIYIQDTGPQSCNTVIRNKRSVIFFIFFSLFQAQRGAFSYFPCFPTDFHSQFMVCCGNDSRRGLLDLEVKA